MQKTAFHCPYCHAVMVEDTASGEEFSCRECMVMVDVLDDEMAMVSVAPHLDVFFMSTSELRLVRLEHAVH